MGGVSSSTGWRLAKNILINLFLVKIPKANPD